MQGIEYNIAALLTIIFIIYARVALLLPIEDQVCLATRGCAREASDSVSCGYQYRIFWGSFNGRV